VRGTSRYTRGMSMVQTSIRLEADDIKALKRIGKRPDIDREWSYLVRKAMQEFIERDRVAQAQAGRKEE
jgi:predicted transcriptional regulator